MAIPILLVALFCAFHASAFSPQHPCYAFPTKVAKLRACSTASAFCSAYLNGPASFTRTSTAISYSTGPAQTTITTLPETTVSTETDTPTVTTDVPTVYSPTNTVYVTTTQYSCPQGNSNKRREARQGKAASASCGIYPSADPSEVSGACNCILAKQTVQTVVSSVSNTAVVTLTSTQDPPDTTVVTVYESSSTVFVTPSPTTVGSGSTTSTVCAALATDTSNSNAMFLLLVVDSASDNAKFATLTSYGYESQINENAFTSDGDAAQRFIFDTSGDLVAVGGSLPLFATATDESLVTSTIQFVTSAQLLADAPHRARLQCSRVFLTLPFLSCTNPFTGGQMFYISVNVQIFSTAPTVNGYHQANFILQGVNS